MNDIHYVILDEQPQWHNIQKNKEDLPLPWKDIIIVVDEQIYTFDVIAQYDVNNKCFHPTYEPSVCILLSNIIAWKYYIDGYNRNAVNMKLYDQEEIYDDCTVQVLRNHDSGVESWAWKIN